MDTEETKIYYAVIFTAGLLIFITLIFFLNLARYSRKFRILKIQKFNEVIELLERERARISADLHDEVGPLLSTIKIQLVEMGLQMNSDNELVKDGLLLVDKVMDTIRSTSTNLIPAKLLDLGLNAAIQEYISVFKNKGMAINYFSRLIPTLNAKIELAIYRILQEIIHNAIKHSEARSLSILISYEHNKMIISTKDNGIGFKIIPVTADIKGFGIYMMYERIQSLNGTLDTKTVRGKGTLYYIQIPVGYE